MRLNEVQILKRALGRYFKDQFDWLMSCFVPRLVKTLQFPCQNKVQLTIRYIWRNTLHSKTTKMEDTRAENVDCYWTLWPEHFAYLCSDEKHQNFFVPWKRTCDLCICYDKLIQSSTEMRSLIYIYHNLALEIIKLSAD